MEQKCTMQELIKILDKITMALGFGHIDEIKIFHCNELISFKDTHGFNR